MKSQFSVTYNNFTLDVCEYDVFQGKCESLGFISGGSPILDDLVNLFRQKVNEFNDTVKIEHRGYELEVKRKQENNAWFVGTCSLLGKDWKVESATIYLVETMFKEAVDEKEALFHIEKLQCQVMLRQKDLENYLKTRGYIFDLIRVEHPQECMALYAIHPDYWNEWNDYTFIEGEGALPPKREGFPKNKVVFVRHK